MRCLLGIFEAFMNPTAYSLIADYYPPSMRARAAAVFNLAIYFGGAMSSLS
jgi:MFS family permease